VVTSVDYNISCHIDVYDKRNVSQSSDDARYVKLIDSEESVIVEYFGSSVNLPKVKPTRGDKQSILTQEESPNQMLKKERLTILDVKIDDSLPFSIVETARMTDIS
jgi:hypothetical protein